MQVAWIPLSLEEARGFITLYVVTYSSDSQRKKRATHTVNVPGDQVSVTIPDLDSNTRYSVSVAATTAAGMGDSSTPVTSPSKLSLSIK